MANRGMPAWVAAHAGGLALLGVLLAAPGLDQPLGRALRAWGSDGFGAWWGEAAYWAGLGGVQLIAMLLLCLGAHWLGRGGLARTGMAAVLAGAASGLAAQVLKHLLGRARPGEGLSSLALTGPTWDSDFHSFPSGHATTSFALAVVLARRYPRGAPFFYGGALFISLGRIISGSHYLSDVMAGVLLGLMAGTLCAFWSQRRAKGGA